MHNDKVREIELLTEIRDLLKEIRDSLKQGPVIQGGPPGSEDSGGGTGEERP
jgi:hypothetical protein